MDFDEGRGRPASSAGERVVVGEPLDRYAIADLEARLVALEDEMARVRATLEAKRAHEANAAAIFKS